MRGNRCCPFIVTASPLWVWKSNNISKTVRLRDFWMVSFDSAMRFTSAGTFGGSKRSSEVWKSRNTSLFYNGERTRRLSIRAEIRLPLSKRFDLELSKGYIRIPWVRVHRVWSRSILIWLYFSRSECKLHVEWGCCLRLYRQKNAGNPRKSINIFATVYLINSWLVWFDSEMVCTSEQIYPQARKVRESFEKFEIHRRVQTSLQWEPNSAFGLEWAENGRVRQTSLPIKWTNVQTCTKCVSHGRTGFIYVHLFEVWVRKNAETCVTENTERVLPFCNLDACLLYIIIIV